VRAVGVELSGPELGDEDVPVIKGPVPHRIEVEDAGRLGLAGAVEKEQLQRRAVLREDTEVDAVTANAGAEGVAVTG
jgi:hypothetical protein